MKREVEIKYLLADKDAQDKLVSSLQEHFPRTRLLRKKVVISYFYKKPRSVDSVLNAGSQLLNEVEFAKLKHILKSSNLVVKARSIGSDVFFALKSAKKGEDAVHAVDRLEFEVKVNTSIENVNTVITNAGIELVSKWYSERSFYELDSRVNADIEFVSGYGYKAELEILTDDEHSQTEEKEIRAIAKELSLQEASQELLGKMYEYYNQHWEDYYKTDKVFPAHVWSKLGRE